MASVIAKISLVALALLMIWGVILGAYLAWKYD